MSKTGPNDVSRVVWALGEFFLQFFNILINDLYYIWDDISTSLFYIFSTIGPIPASSANFFLYNIIFTTYACEQALINFICIMYVDLEINLIQRI